MPFKTLLDGRVTYRGSLAKMGGPYAIIVLRNDVRAELGKGAGESVEVRVELDDQPRQVTVASDIKKALSAAKVWDNFEKLSYTHRREYIQWIEGAKKPMTRERRRQKMCGMLVAEDKKLHANLLK